MKKKKKRIKREKKKRKEEEQRKKNRRVNKPLRFLDCSEGRGALHKDPPPAPHPLGSPF